jgi:hypothetical protein
MAVAAPSAPVAPATPTNHTGLYVAVAVVGSVAVSGTPVAPVVAALLGVALIYQLNLLLQGK